MAIFEPPQAASSLHRRAHATSEEANALIVVPASAHLEPSDRTYSAILKQVITDTPRSLEIHLTHQGPTYLIRVPAWQKPVVQAGLGALTLSLHEEADVGHLLHYASTQQFVGTPRSKEKSLPFATIPMRAPGTEGRALDPLQSLSQLCALLRPGESALYQLIVQRAPDAFVRKYENKAISQTALRLDVADGTAAVASPPNPKAMAATLLAAFGGLCFLLFLLPVLFGLRPGGANVLSGLLAAASFFTWFRIRGWAYSPLAGPVAPEIVKQKLGAPACFASLRISLDAEPRRELTAAIEDALRLLDEPANGNGFVLTPTRQFDPNDLTSHFEPAWMNTPEITTYFHQYATSAERSDFSWLPPSRELVNTKGGFPFGLAGRAPNLDTFRFSIRQLTSLAGLFLAGRGGGKSNARQLLVRGVIEEIAGSRADRLSLTPSASPASSYDALALVNIDPFSRVARYDFGDYPPELADRLHILCCDPDWAPIGEQTFTFNALWCRAGTHDAIDRQVEALVESWRYYHQETRDGSWGDRMETLAYLVFRIVMHANRQWMANKEHEAPKYGLLDALSVVRHRTFGEQLIEEANGRHNEVPELRDQWRDWFLRYTPIDLTDVINPFTNKLDNIRAHRRLRAVIGGPSSTVDLGQLVDDGCLISIDLPQAVLGSASSRFLLSTLLNMLLIHLEQRTSDPAFAPPPLLVFIDEPHLVPADIGKLYAVLRQKGGSPWLFTQTMAHFDEVPGLRDSIQSNLGAVFFNRVVNPSDIKFSEPWIEGRVPPSALKDIGPGYWYAGITGPPFSLQARYVPPANDVSRRKAEALVQRDTRPAGGPKHVRLYRPITEIDQELLASQVRWDEQREATARMELARRSSRPSKPGSPRTAASDNRAQPAISQDLSRTRHFRPVEPDQSSDSGTSDAEQS